MIILFDQINLPNQQEVEQEFSVGIGNATQKKHQFRSGDEITGECLPVWEEEDLVDEDETGHREFDE